MIPWDWIGIVTIAERHLLHDLDDGDDQAQPGLPGADDPAQPEHDALLVLLDDADRQGQQGHDDDRDDDERDGHTRNRTSAPGITPGADVLLRGTYAFSRFRSTYCMMPPWR